MAEQRFENFTFHGGQQVFGDHNTVSQTNHYGDERDAIVGQLETIRRTAPDPAAVESDVAAIEQALAHPTEENRGRIQQAIDGLTSKLGTVQTAAEAFAAVGVIAGIVAANWPF
ncbi:hypothetical protein Ait01nite_039520 [Actinoplanes italicus]|uniref:Uncharacterized protein n=1 Tax=Actinoplanes italicus TaxID=113567 RepID=A0A2T0JWE2_9ACTN|nr:hypothetical protein [Actinoplanes italicus]PRX12023.1 hypothetical protein CLV67_13048 [Actinoplanes italicus]GIE30907.1 hypothetical protein Ait01nite_039520 [Actinoplanes italicus]